MDEAFFDMPGMKDKINPYFYGRHCMRRLLFPLIIISLLLPSCSKNFNNTTSATAKPKYHHRWYDRKKDKQTKRVRFVRMS